MIGAWLVAALVPDAASLSAQAAAVETVLEGKTVTLTATVDSGTGPFFYQWNKNGVTVPNEMGPILRFPAIQLADTGTYIAYVINAAGTARSEPVRLRVQPINPSRISNFSIMATGTGQLIAGFVVGGNGATATTSFLARASGPALAQFGVTDGLTDPVLTLFDQRGPLAANENWFENETISSAAVSVGAFAFPPRSLDAGLLIALSPSSYTAQVTDTLGGTGTALMELFDLSTSSGHTAPRLVNLSARTNIVGRDQPLTAGFTIRGTSPATVMIRAIGPGLAQFGITDALLDPKLSLYRNATLLSANDDWRNSDVFTITATAKDVGAFSLPVNSLDSVILTMLPPGSYTVQLSNAGAAPGTALLEVYEVP